MSPYLKKSIARNVFMSLCRHWRTEKALVLRSVAFVAVGIVADLTLPLFSGRLVDVIVERRTLRAEGLHTALDAMLVMSGLGVVLIMSRHFAMLSIGRLNVRLMSRFARDSFWRVQRLSSEWHANNHVGSSLRRITRGMWAVDTISDLLLLSLLPALLILAGSSIILALRWPSMGLIVAVGSVLFVGSAVYLSLNYVSPNSRLANAQDTRFSSVLADALVCNSVVKAFGAETREDRRLTPILNKWERRIIRSVIANTGSGTIKLSVLLGLRTLVTAQVIWLWWNHRASAGDLTFVLATYLVVHSYLRDIGQVAANLQRAINEIEEMVQLHFLPIAPADADDARFLEVRGAEIVFDSISFAYKAQMTPLFHDFSLRIRPGERVGLVGYSGAGKSTVIKLLQRLYETADGRILIDGQDISRVTLESVRSQIALVSQEPILFDRSVAENIAYGYPHADARQVQEAAQRANADEFIRRLPRGYATRVGERGGGLSGGERQRIALARAFLANRRILVLDEATSNLDSESEAAILEAMERLMTGRTVIIIAHRLSTVESLDRILVLDSGRIAQDGTHETLITQHGIYRRLFAGQASGKARRYWSEHHAVPGGS
jgi:ATP-binding cassette subfamily B protein